MKTIKFKNLNVNNLHAFIQNSEAGNFNHTYELTKDAISCRAFPTDKKFVKYTSISMADIFLFDSLPDDFVSLKLPIYALKKLKTALSVLDDVTIENAGGSIEYYPDESNGGLIASCIEFKGNKTKNKVKATDPSMFSYISPEKFNDLMSGVDMFSFDIDVVLKDRIQKLFEIDNDNTFTIKANGLDSTVTVCSGGGGDMWSHTIDKAVVVQSLALDVSKEAILRMKMNLYKVTFRSRPNGVFSMTSVHDSDNMLCNFSVLHDPNRLPISKK